MMVWEPSVSMHVLHSVWFCLLFWWRDQCAHGNIIRHKGQEKTPQDTNVTLEKINLTINGRDIWGSSSQLLHNLRLWICNLQLSEEKLVLCPCPWTKVRDQIFLKLWKEIGKRFLTKAHGTSSLYSIDLYNTSAERWLKCKWRLI